MRQSASLSDEVMIEGEQAEGNGVITAEHASMTLKAPSGQVAIYRDISVSLKRGRVLVVVGPSGCGKTMFLHSLLGAERPTQGTVRVFGEAPRIGDRRVSYGMARDALLPWRTAVENVELALEGQGIAKGERRQRALAALAAVGLEGHGDRYRAELSQGMRQRVALARVFVTRPELLLLDEPFAALDAQTRQRMQELLAEMVGSMSCSALLVTHDIAEGIAVGDDLVVFSDRPARIASVWHLPERWSRDPRERREDEEFHALVVEVGRQLRDSVERA